MTANYPQPSRDQQASASLLLIAISQFWKNPPADLSMEDLRDGSWCPSDVVADAFKLSEGDATSTVAWLRTFLHNLLLPISASDCARLSKTAMSDLQTTVACLDRTAEVRMLVDDDVFERRQVYCPTSLSDSVIKALLERSAVYFALEQEPMPSVTRQAQTSRKGRGVGSTKHYADGARSAAALVSSYRYFLQICVKGRRGVACPDPLELAKLYEQLEAARSRRVRTGVGRRKATGGSKCM